PNKGKLLNRTRHKIAYILFNSVLNSLNFSDVQTAMDNYEKIVEQCELNLIEKKTCGYSFYEENPSCSVGETIKIILKDCKLSS
ncbi:hypothetical protein, partial [Turicimonas muris]